MKKAKILFVILVATLCCVLLAGCANGDFEFDEGVNNAPGNIVADGVNRKLVYYVSLNLHTEDVAATLTKIETETKTAGGYIERQESYGDENDEYVYMSVRIPTNKLDAFLETISQEGKVSSKRISIDDITSEYIDASAQKAALENRKQLLQDILNTEGISASDKIAVINEISKVDAELQSLQQQLARYDSMTDFSTVTIRLNEESDDVAGVVAGIFAVLFVTSLVAAVVVFVILFVKEKRKNKKFS